MGLFPVQTLHNHTSILVVVKRPVEVDLFF